jgi:hypothetical protein
MGRHDPVFGLGFALNPPLPVVIVCGSVEGPLMLGALFTVMTAVTGISDAGVRPNRSERRVIPWLEIESFKAIIRDWPRRYLRPLHQAIHSSHLRSR